MTTDPTKLTAGEIVQYRELLADNPEALNDLKVIERCEGNLEQAARVLARRASVEEFRADEIWQLALQKACEIVCDEKFKGGLVPGLIGGLIGVLTNSGSPLLAAVATPTSIYIAQFGIDAFCQANQSNSES
ncbi:MAG: hypothetical protein QNJ55_14590 [Xenococcus sp. MO_188.B8]|nr:hypothetical protein [Xenococcus sp. MO_188.B8]